MIHLDCSVETTARIKMLEGKFDFHAENISAFEIAELPLDEINSRRWNVGAILGNSGSGKSTTARHAFKTELIESFEWSHDKALVDDFPEACQTSEITEALTLVGLASPPSWIRPYSTLSNGEQFRAFMGRALLENKGTNKPLVIDEFTSVVDRRVAQIASHSVQKYVRKNKMQFVAVTCHFDVEDWLQPDWVYYTDTQKLVWRSVQPRPSLNVRIRRAHTSEWKQFRKHHYLNHEISNGSTCFIAEVEKMPACFVAILPVVHKQKGLFRVSRIVVLPDFQGIGLSSIILDMLGGALRAYNKKLFLRTTHPAMVAALKKSENWALRSVGKSSSQGGYKKSMNRTTATNRLSASFQYRGPVDTRLNNLLTEGMRKTVEGR